MKNKIKTKYYLLFTFILSVIFVRATGLDIYSAAILGGIFGIIGLIVILLSSPRRGKMVHCLVYCPIGTIVMWLKNISPFRMYISKDCNRCLKCMYTCNYDALTKNDIKKYRPGPTCTNCGDCIISCSSESIKYKFLNLSPEASRNLWLIITVSLHVIFLGTARI